MADPAGLETRSVQNMAEPSDEHRWHEALERLGPAIVRANPESPPENASSGVPTPAAGTAVPPEPVVDPSLHGENPTGETENSGLQSLRYWAAVAGVAGVIAALTGLLALLPMSMR
jgi:hypothetical protein